MDAPSATTEVEILFIRECRKELARLSNDGNSEDKVHAIAEIIYDNLGIHIDGNYEGNRPYHEFSDCLNIARELVKPLPSVGEEEIEELIIEFGIEWSIPFSEFEPKELAKSILTMLGEKGE